AQMKVRRIWQRTIINKAYDAVLKAQGNGILASEMFRSTLLCMSGIHDFSSDPSFTQLKRCTHSPPPPTPPGQDTMFIERDGRAYKRLQEVIFTDKNIDDIQNVSWLLKTSTCESLNALAWRYAPKDNYFDRKGHELRTMMGIIHWNQTKKDELEGTRIVTGQKAYFNHTLKKHVFRNVKTPARNAWREAVKKATYEV
ncbi:hypothetical protein PENTCL1PPCAC_3750, partial [Pristionchus entomophagus]